jgi:hypothetical protein
MAGVEKVKTTIGKNNFFSVLLHLLQLFLQQAGRYDMIFQRVGIHLKERCTERP